MKKLLFLIFITLSLPVTLFSQDQDLDFPKIFYRNEKTLGINLNTNGWGLGYRYGNRVNFFEKKLYEIDFSLIKHTKEVKSTSSFITSESIIFGKLNYAFDLKAGYGKQNEIYSKHSPGSVAVRSFYSFGPSVAILKPIYYEILYALNDSVYGIQEEKFNPDIHTPGDISGKASFFKGIDELKLIPGAYIKLGINFEFSQSEHIIHAIEAGAMFTAYLKNLEIMAVDDNQQYFLVLFASYRFGKVTNAQELSPEYLKKQKRKLRILKRNR